MHNTKTNMELYWIFCFQLERIGLIQGIKGPNHIGDDNSNFRKPYKLNEVERALVQDWTIKLLDASLVEL